MRICLCLAVVESDPVPVEDVIEEAAAPPPGMRVSDNCTPLRPQQRHVCWIYMLMLKKQQPYLSLFYIVMDSVYHSGTAAAVDGRHVGKWILIWQGLEPMLPVQHWRMSNTGKRWILQFYAFVFRIDKKAGIYIQYIYMCMCTYL